MRLTAEQLTPLGVDGGLIHFIDTAFLSSEQPKRLGVAVSGGGDSMALLHAACIWSDLSGVPLEAVTVNHGLRSEAVEEAAMVADFCAARAVPHAVLTWDGHAATGNIAAAGREARYALIADWAKTRGIGGVLLGHTQDDVAETFLMRLARKSGVDGLALMDVRFDRNGVRWARPFWQQTRAELREYLRRHDVPWVDDPTNDDESHDRPKARKVLAALAPLGIDTDMLKTVALNMADARTALETQASRAYEELVRTQAGDVTMPHRPRPPLPPDTQRRLWIAALAFVGGGAYPPRRHALLDLEHRLLQAGKHTLNGCLVTVTDGELRFTREFSACTGPVPLAASGETQWDGRWRIRQVTGTPRSGLTVAALGDALHEVPDWRDLRLPRETLRVSPAIFDGDRLISAPIAQVNPDFEARIVAGMGTFLLSR